MGISSICALLGQWQLDRADWKAGQIQQALAKRDLPAINLDSPENVVDLELWRKVRLVAERASMPLIYLDNQTRPRQSGYQVYIPIRLRGTASVALWRSSWLPVGADRNILPGLGPDAGAPNVPIEAILQAPPSAGIDLGGPEGSVEQMDGALRVQRIDFAVLSELLGAELIPYILSTANNAARPQYRTGVERHKAYAFQWFALGLLLPALLIFYVIRSRWQQRKVN